MLLKNPFGRHGLTAAGISPHLIKRDALSHPNQGYASLSIKSYGQAYVCEISSRENRGLNTSVYMISYCMGIVSMAFLGTIIVNWRMVVSIIAIVALLAVLGGLFIHDRWLCKIKLSLTYLKT